MIISINVRFLILHINLFLFFFLYTKHLLPKPSWSDDDCIFDYKLRCEQRTTFPGASAFDFSSILSIVIANILGWDEEEGIPFTDGGAFGKLDGFGGAIEEQGRKTLHAHMLLYIKALARLLEALQKSHRADPNRSRLKLELTNYIDKVMSTRLHRAVAACQLSYAHPCNTRNAPYPQPVPKETLRANRHKRSCVATKGIITQCPLCGLSQTSEEHILKRLREICPELETFPDYKKHRLEIWIMRHIYTYPKLESIKEKEDAEFLISAFFNLHRSVHAKGCFKYGMECRYNLPTLHNSKTEIDVHEGIAVWYTIFGVRELHHPFTIKLKRSIFDVNMNTYNHPSSIAIGTNTNTNIGEIRTIFYASTYSTKHTQEDDRESFKRVVDSFIRRSLKRKAAEEANSGEQLIECVFTPLFVAFSHLDITHSFFVSFMDIPGTATKLKKDSVICILRFCVIVKPMSLALH